MTTHVRTLYISPFDYYLYMMTVFKSLI